ncbi:MAG: energy transducer TonB [Bacteroidetes bacterium]|nr:energy transducer TonB [Bacteroidota bacterium]
MRQKVLYGLVFMLLSLLCLPVVLFSQNVKQAEKLFNLAVESHKKMEYSKADSLYTESMKYVTFINTFRNRGLCRVAMGRGSEACEDFISGNVAGDTMCKALYVENCQTRDTFYVTQNYKQATPADYYYKIVFWKYKYESRQRYFRYLKSGKADLSYENDGKDTAYYSFPGATYDTALYFSTMLACFKNIKYPQSAKEAGIQGKVILKVFVNEDGTIYNREVIRTPLKEFADIVIKLTEIITLPPLKTSDGKSKKSIFYMPVNFTLR